MRGQATRAGVAGKASLVMACRGCDNNLREIVLLSQDVDRRMDFLVAHNLIRKESECPYCGRSVKIRLKNPNKPEFRCCGGYFESALSGTFLSRSHVSQEQSLILVYCFIHNYTAGAASHESGVGLNTVVNRFKLYREFLVSFYQEHPVRLGGPGEKVEVHVAKFGNLRNKKDRNWVLGGCERGSGKIFLAVIEAHTKAAVIKKIREFVVSDTTIITDRWEGYDNLHRHGYDHIAVGHHLARVDHLTEAHLQNIHVEWKNVKSSLPKAGSYADGLDGYLALYMFRKSFPDNAELFHHFLSVIAFIYPPHHTSRHLKQEREEEDR